MTIETLKDLIKREFERSKAIGVVEENVMYLLDLYAKDQLPDYRIPQPGPYIDPAGYYPTTGAYIAKDYPPGTTITNTPGVTGNITVTN